ncbi:pyridoxal phosphate-dependent aminotransferase [Kribbella speibonae]|uniref:Aminotransferase n=1 Tax=Kribbella speibonae TaxID=1572660 RepID=A0A4R0IF23_9ACTN|nr:pyridoxal phosphate-dependent aminotransferase [Kribbella speibonae]TCC19492.1 pyridoxal phosphate-dependent aminotransferase [Kribbella speibonae]TCC31851.1 pyridoxal phosphate-dependent aminotransferase [Kribbella speibonae]
MPTFPRNPIMSLTAEQPRHELGESYGPDLRLADLLTPELGDLELGYGTAAGDVKLRTAIADRHGVRPEDVVVTVGGMHGIFLLAYLLEGEVVTTAPQFPMTRNAFDTVGAPVRAVPLTFDDGYRVTAEAVRAQLTPQTRLVSLATPQNPSGVAVPPETLREILEAMGEVCPDAYLMVDETYRTAAYGDDPIVDTALRLGPKVVSVASLSKCHGAAGLRIGWVISTDEDLIEQLTTAKFSTVVTASPVTEALAVRVFEQEDKILGERRIWLEQNLRITEDWVNANSALVEWVRPSAGALCVVRLAADVDLERFRRTAAELGVRLADGDWFGDDPRVFRLGFGFLPVEDLKAALDALREALRAAR